jgi:hypothetical protein
MPKRPWALSRSWHGATFVVSAFALVLQLVLVWKGHSVLDQTEPPDLATRLVRYLSYLTIWSNVLVAWSAATLALGLDRDTRAWRALRLDAVIVCFGGGVVHFFLLRPVLDVHGADLLADRLLHLVVPLLAVAGWFLFGPRGRVSRSDLLPFLALPVLWLVYTLLRGAFVTWYPYPFLDVAEHGYGRVLLTCVGVGGFLVALFLGASWLDRVLPHVGRRSATIGRPGAS